MITIYRDLRNSTRGTVVDQYVEEKVADMAVLHSWREWSPGVLQYLQRECIERWTVGKIIQSQSQFFLV